MNTITEAPVKFTGGAVAELKRLFSEPGFDTTNHLRIGVKGGGCSGLMYDLNFDDEVKPADQIFEDKGIKILVDKKSLLYLLGTTLDFSY